MTKFKYNPVRFSIFAMFLIAFLILKTVDLLSSRFWALPPQKPSHFADKAVISGTDCFRSGNDCS